MTNIKEERHRFPVYTALAHCNREVVVALLIPNNNLYSSSDVAYLKSKLNQELKRLFKSNIKKFIP